MLRSFTTTSVLLIGLTSCIPIVQDDNNSASNKGASDFMFSADGSIFLLTTNGDLLRSDRDGISWEAVYSFCPQEEICPLYVTDIVPGIGDSIWASMIRFDPTGAALAISRDGGRTFSTIEDVYFGLIENQGDNPILVSNNGQLWYKDLESADNVASVEPLGLPNPDAAAIGPAVLCFNTIFVSGWDARRANRIWQSIDQGMTWASDVEGFSPPHLACGAGQNLWALVDRTPLFYDKSSSNWIGMGKLDLCISCASGIAADKSYFYVAGRDIHNKSLIVRIPPLIGPVPDYGHSWLPLPNPADEQLYKLKISPSGDLWASSIQTGLFRFYPDSYDWIRVWPQ